MSLSSHRGGNASGSSSSIIKDLQAPTSPENLRSTREQIILLQGSKLHGCIFKPWQEPVSVKDGPTEPFEDTTDVYFSPEQREIFAGWKRPSLPPVEAGSKDTTPTQKHPIDLVQDVTSDCSVVASLCAETARAERLGPGRESLVKAMMYPQPDTARASKYALKLNFNGCFRRVEIDDRLPASKTKERTLHVFDRSNPEGVSWPGLVEKAYLKVRGGYDFPGSNSATDLWVLIGWVPEQLPLQSDDIVPNSFWKKHFQAFNYGDVLVTMGTPHMSRNEEKALGLASDHAYAVVDMREENGRREFLIKNPWSEGDVWTGASGLADEDRKHSREAMKPGTFWMDLNNVFANFETIFLNWNPGLFMHRRDVHFSWDLNLRSLHGSFERNPQYSILCDKDTSVWIVLSKHFQNFKRPDEQDKDPTTPDPRLQIGHLSLYAYETEYRVMLTDGALHRARYLDAPTILLRFEAQAKVPYTIVVSEQGLPSSKFEFSMSVFTRSALQLSEASRRYMFCTEQSGAWTYTTAGGNSGSPEYCTNPQFSLTIPKPSDTAILLEAEDPDLAVHVKLVWAGGKRIPAKITNKDIFGDSGEYRRGCALAQIRHVNAGNYTIVCSTFKPGQLGKFNLKVWSMSDKCVLKPIPIHVPGMFSLQMESATLLRGTDRVLAPVTVQRLTRLHVRARSIPRSSTSSESPIKLSIEYGQGPNKDVPASTDKFIEASGGIRTPDVDIKPAMCAENAPGVWIVVERMLGSSLDSPERVAVEIFSSEQGVQVGPWGKKADEKIEELQKQMAAASVSSRSSR